MLKWSLRFLICLVTWFAISAHASCGPNLDEIQPSQAGRLAPYHFAATEWFEFPLPPDLIAHHLPVLLEPFAPASLTLSAAMKRNILFTPAVAAFLLAEGERRRLMSTGRTVTQLLNAMAAGGGGPRQRFNVVIRKDRVIFMRVSPSWQPTNRLAGKHLVLAGYAWAPFAGDCWLQFNDDGTFDVHLTPESGTFRSTPNHLAGAVPLVTRLLGNVRVIPDDSIFFQEPARSYKFGHFGGR